MNTDSDSPDSKANRKASAASAATGHKGAYRDTAFGRRRRRKLPEWALWPFRRIGAAWSSLFGGAGSRKP